MCVLCCRTNHSNNVLHRIEKWNGRYYQKGGLWQVGVKLYTGHNGSPCPKSTAALSGTQSPSCRPTIHTSPLLSTIATEFNKTEQDILRIISDALSRDVDQMTAIERQVLEAIAEKSGQELLDLIRVFNKAVTVAEAEADDLHAKSDQATMEAEAEEERDVPFPQVVVDIPFQDDYADEDWEDEDNRPDKSHVPRFLPRPPPRDGMGNTMLTIVHTNGFHSLPVVWCACQGHHEDRDLQLLDMRFYPASFTNIKTAFTFSCLDDYRLENLECKTSHYQYHNKLRRLTSPSHPETAPNRYAELCRVARQWRNLKYRKWFWLLGDLNAKRGEMALFCAACPQPGINLEPDWEADQAQRP